MSLRVKVKPYPQEDSEGLSVMLSSTVEIRHPVGYLHPGSLKMKNVSHSSSQLLNLFAFIFVPHVRVSQQQYMRSPLSLYLVSRFFGFWN